MHAFKAIFSQGSHFLVRMAPLKSFQKVGLSPKGSFGRCRDAAVWFSSGHVCRNVSGSSSAKMLSVGSSATANPKVVLQRSSTKYPTIGFPSRHQLENVPSSSASSWSNATNSRHIHRGVDKEDDWSLGADKKDLLRRKVSSKGTKKGLLGRQQSDFGPVERRSSASGDRIYFLGRLL